MAASDDRINSRYIDVVTLQLNCEKDKAKIAHYAKCLIDGQLDNFEEGVTPWGNLKCEDDTDTALLAIQHGTPCPEILGWLRYTTDTIAGLNIVFVNAISTAKRKYKHVGGTLMDILLRKMEMTHDIIELSPLSQVIGFYTKLGYEPLYDGGPYYQWISQTKYLDPKLIDQYRSETIKSERELEAE